MTSPIATFGLLRALGHMSPKAALARAARGSVALGELATAWADSSGLERLDMEWIEGETPCAVHAILGAVSRGSRAAYCFMDARRWHPSTIIPALLSEGIPLLYEMTKRAMWVKSSEPLDTFIVVALEHGGDAAQFVLGDSFEELGKEQFRKALGAYRRAERDGWPGWEDAGVQLLDLPDPTPQEC